MGHAKKAQIQTYFQRVPVPAIRLSFVLGCHFLLKLGFNYICLPEDFLLSQDPLTSLLFGGTFRAEGQRRESMLLCHLALLVPIVRNLHLKAEWRPEILWRVGVGAAQVLLLLCCTGSASCPSSYVVLGLPRSRTCSVFQACLHEAHHFFS